MPRKARRRRASKAAALGQLGEKIHRLGRVQESKRRFDTEQERLKEGQKAKIQLDFQRAGTAGTKAQAQLEQAKADLAESKRRGTKDAATLANEERRVAALEGRLGLDREKFAFDKSQPASARQQRKPFAFEAAQTRLGEALTPNFDDSPLAGGIMQISKNLSNNGFRLSDPASLPELLSEIETVFGDEEFDEISKGMIANYIVDQADQLPFVASAEEVKSFKQRIAGIIQAASTPQALAGSKATIPPGGQPNSIEQLGDFVSQNLLPIPTADMDAIIDMRLRGK